MRSKFLPFEILYEDRDLIAIDKPEGLLTTHTKLVGRAAREAQPTAENFLNGYVRKGQLKSRNRVWLVHRLDRETSGVLLFAKRQNLAERIRSDWNRLTEKIYVARVEGSLDAPCGVFESWLREDDDGYRVRSVPAPRGGNPSNATRLARTEWRVLSSEGDTTLVEVSLKSGRKNQIRVHFSEAGHPVVGDVKYGAKPARRLMLHARRLGFTHPDTGRRFVFESESPVRAR